MYSVDPCFIGLWEYVVGAYNDITNDQNLYRDGILSDNRQCNISMPNDNDHFAV
jgi:hypothetical protein